MPHLDLDLSVWEFGVCVVPVGNAPAISVENSFNEQQVRYGITNGLQRDKQGHISNDTIFIELYNNRMI